eukprot:1118781-Karenia_brevis.AAC.1
MMLTMTSAMTMYMMLMLMAGFFVVVAVAADAQADDVADYVRDNDFDDHHRMRPMVLIHFHWSTS